MLHRLGQRTTEATEAVPERARVVPKSCAPVLAVHAVLGTTTADKNDGDNHEDDGGEQLEQRGPELFLCIAECAKKVQNDDYRKEDLQTDVSVSCDQLRGTKIIGTYADPNRDARFRRPILDDGTADGQFERQDESPLNDVVPAHSETPRRINEAIGQSGRVWVHMSAPRTPSFNTARSWVPNLLENQAKR